MQVTLSYREQITTECEVQSISWASAESQQIGRATLRIPNGHPAYDRRYVAEDKGSTAMIADETLGSWRGIVVRTNFVNDGEAVILTCHDQRALFNGLPTGRQRFTLTTAGAIVRTAFRQAVGARSRVGLSEGTFVENAPLIHEYEVSRDSFRDVLNAMMERTGQEWVVDTDGRFHWVPRQGSIIERPLVQGDDIYGVDWETGVIDRVTEIIAVDDDGSETRFLAPELADGGFWVARTISTGDSGADLHSRALRMLEDQRHPQPSVTATLAKHLWGEIREGDIRRLVIPSAGFRGDSPMVRFQTREFNGTSGELSVTMTVLPHMIDEAIV